MRNGTRRVLRSPSQQEGRRPRTKFIAGSAIQVFVLRVDAFLGTELFGAEVPVTIGRHRDCAIRLDSDTVSRVHCRIQLDGDQLFIEDMGSANGTLLNSERIQGRTEALSTDAIQVGEYTLKLRALVPRKARQARPNSGISDRPTRKKARVSADGFVDTDESLIDIERKVDPRLYEAALRRATGNEPPKTPVPLVVMDGGRKIEEESSELEQTFRDEVLIEQVRDSKEPPTKRGFEIDTCTDERINELEKAVLALNEATPEKISRQKSTPKKANVFKAWVDQVNDSPVDELARAIGTAAAHRPATSPWKNSRGKKIEPVKGIQARGRLQSVRARRTTEKSNVPLALSVPTEIPVTDKVRARLPKGMRKKQVPKRDISALRITPVSVIQDQSSETEQVVQRTSPAKLKEVLVQRVPIRARETPTKAKRRRLPARLVTPSSFQSCVAPISKAPQKRHAPEGSAFSLVQDQDIVARKKIASKRPRGLGADDFRAIEITSRQRGRLVDIATLSQNGEQYILGYPTPQGAKAPSCGHLGLRLIRINPDRTVDLVFPRDAGGHLMRDSEAVMFSELTQGRKYSSVRLTYSDQVTLILNHKGKQVSYHIRFLQNPQL